MEVKELLSHLMSDTTQRKITNAKSHARYKATLLLQLMERGKAECKQLLSHLMCETQEILQRDSVVEGICIMYVTMHDV